MLELRSRKMTTKVTKESDVCLAYAVDKLLEALDSLGEDLESNKLDDAIRIAKAIKKYVETKHDHQSN